MYNCMKIKLGSAIDELIAFGGPFVFKYRSKVAQRFSGSSDPDVLERAAPDHTKALGLRLDLETFEQLERVSSLLGVSRSELVRDMIAQPLEWLDEVISAEVDK